MPRLGKVSWAVKPFLWQFRCLFQRAAQSSSMTYWGKVGRSGIGINSLRCNPKFESGEMHAAESFCTEFWGNEKGTLHLVLASSRISTLSLSLLDLTHVRTHFTLQSLLSLSCDLTRAKGAPANAALVPCRAEKKPVLSDLRVCHTEREGEVVLFGDSQCFQSRRAKQPRCHGGHHFGEGLSDVLPS